MKRKLRTCLLSGCLALSSAFAAVPMLPVLADEYEEEASFYAQSKTYGPVHAATDFEKDPDHYYLYGSSGRSNWSECESIYHFAGSGKLTTVVFTGGSNMEVHEFDSSLKQTGVKKLKLPLPKTGGVYQAKDGSFYVACGQDNPQENKSAKVVSIVKYNSGWKETGRCDFSASQMNMFEGIVEAFDAASADMSELDGVLYLHMGRSMFKGSDGLNHQSDLTLAVNMSSMSAVTLGDTYHGSNGSITQPYSSHSFRQLIGSDGSALYFVNHGDAYPRGVDFSKALPGGALGEVTVFAINGKTGDNFTGTTVGDMAITSGNVLIAGSSQPHSNAIKGVTSSGSRSDSLVQNLYLTVSDKNDGATKFNWLTSNNPKSSNISYGVPRMVQVSADRVVLMASLFDKSKPDTDFTHYFVLDGQGKVLVDYIYENIPFFDGQKPVFFNNAIYWLADQYPGTAAIYTIPYAEKKSDINFNPSSLKAGWVKNGSKWNYRLKGGALIKADNKNSFAAYTIDGKGYGFDYDGNMITGWKKDAAGKWYYFKKDGSMATKWLNIGGTHYYFYGNGEMASNTWAEGYKLRPDGSWDKAAGYHPENSQNGWWF